MFMGYTAAVNIHQQMLQGAFRTEPKFVEINEIPPMIALAVGKKAVLYGPQEGTTWGEAQMEMMFGEDLGWTSKFSKIWLKTSRMLMEYCSMLELFETWSGV